MFLPCYDNFENDISELPSVLLNGGHGGAMAELRSGFLKKRHRIAVAWRVKDGGAMAAAIAMAAMADVAEGGEEGREAGGGVG